MTDEKRPPPAGSLKNLADLTRKVVAVPKAEVDSQGRQYRAEKKRRRRRL